VRDPAEEESSGVLSRRVELHDVCQGNGLWIKEPADEPKLLDALKNEKELTLKLTPAKGPVTTDRYSLTGLPQALERVAKECP
jgi:invasion protein IalB